VGKFDLAQLLKREGKVNFPRLREMTEASDENLYGVVQSMISMGLVEEMQGNYALTKRGQRWYRQRLGQEWGY
jgi:hypothetical protein